ncbi:hypothetical protein RRF57_010004 [Xylaria bambusicola]|uniref:Uncharacterized protein n=1 Tax=Xylaria bambusicola TaxID=326684 RepID=A0AAN7UKJ9_9PEZI
MSKEGHKSSNVKKLIVTDAEGKEKMTVVKSDDDSHITLRMGTSSNVTNLHGHFYLIYEGNNCKNVAIRMMHEDERGIKGGKNPQLWVWGPYPDHYKRSPIKYPKSPFEIKPGSILDKQRIMEERDSD